MNDFDSAAVTYEPSCSSITVRVEELKPMPDPSHIFQRVAGLPHAVFLDSASSHPALGPLTLPSPPAAGGEGRVRGYSFLTADPFDWLCSRGNRVFTFASTEPVSALDPFAILAGRLAKCRIETIPGLPPFQGGAAGLFGYDLCHHLERLPRPRCDEFEIPDMAVGFYDWVIAYDHAAGRCWLISTGLPETDPQRRRLRAEQRLLEVKNLLSGEVAGGDEEDGGWRIEDRGWRSDGSILHPPSSILHPPSSLQTNTSPPQQLVPQGLMPNLPGLTSNFNRETYLATIRRAIEYIHAGDCFQVNLAQRLLYPAHLAPVELYRRLRKLNPAPFAGYFDLGDFVVASISPERFLRLQDGLVEARPIKGTRPRSLTPAEDQAQIHSLLSSAKDRAENVMIVDLLRNDLGRVCKYGSVDVAALCRLETYPFVHHLVSEVRGQLRLGVGCCRSAARGVPRRLRDRRAQDSCHGDHRRAGTDGARALLRLPGVHRF